MMIICFLCECLFIRGMKCSDYRRMDEHDQYETVGLDESFEDDRDPDQVIKDRREAELELEARDVRFSNRKLPQLLHDNGIFFFTNL